MNDRPEPSPNGDLRQRAAAWLFGAYVVAALPLLMLVIGRFWWFYRDDWFFITDRDLSMDGLFDDHSGHWVTLPVILFRVLYSVIGLRSYMPYQVTVVTAHLLVVVCIRVLMRRYGVGPWLSTALAGSLVLLGSGREDILWAFQAGFTGSMALVLIQWVCADRPGKLDRIDLAGVACGVLSLAAGSPSIPVLAALGLTLIVRRNWRAAAFHVLPPLSAYLVWSSVISPKRSLFGRPTIGNLWDWVRYGLGTTFHQLTGFRGSAILLAAVVAAGTVLAVLARRDSLTTTDIPAGSGPDVASSVHRLRQLAVPVIGPVTLFGATVLFILLAAQRAWAFGPPAAGASRYLYFYIALTLPLIGLAIEQFSTRWRPAAPLLALLVLAGIPSNIAHFNDPGADRDHHTHQRDLLLNVTRSPAIVYAPDDLRPDPDVFNSPGLNVGFLRQAERDGKLPEMTAKMSSQIAAELTIRLGIFQGQHSYIREKCKKMTVSRLQAPLGTTIIINDTIGASLHGFYGEQDIIKLQPGFGSVLNVVAPELDLNLAAMSGGPATVCVTFPPE